MPTEVACYSARLVVPFLRALAERGVPLPMGANDPGLLDPDTRVPIAKAEANLLALIRLTGEPNLGLVAGRGMITGDCPALDYAVSTAATVPEAVATAARYARLANDALTINLDVGPERALFRVASSVALHRASSDFMMASLYACHVQHWPHEGSHLACLFAHARPDDIAEYERTFGGAELQFGAECYGFAFDRGMLELTPKGADPRLNAMAQKYASLMLAGLPTAQTHRDQVRKLLPAELAQGRTGAEETARKLGMSVRTLGRRLEEEGTNYKAVVDDVRRELALEHIVRHDMSMAEIACLLGFAEVTGFYRAFRRWTGQAPGSYRAARPRLG